MTNLEIIKQGYSHFSNGNMEAVLALFDPSIEWNECKGMPFAKCDGVSIGPEAIVTDVFMNLPVFFDGFNIVISDLFAAEDKVVMEGYYQGTNKATGNLFKANATHIWTVKNGKVTRFFQAVDTVTIMS